MLEDDHAYKGGLDEHNNASEVLCQHAGRHFDSRKLTCELLPCCPAGEEAYKSQNTPL